MFTDREKTCSDVRDDVILKPADAHQHNLELSVERDLGREKYKKNNSPD